MKKVLILCWVLVGSYWVDEVVAQNQKSVAKPASKEPVRQMDKEEIADEAQEKWAVLQKKFQGRARKRGPFGSSMDPSVQEEEVVSVAAVVGEKVAVKKVALLQDAVNKFEVQVVSPKKQMVMVGFRSLHRGDTVEIEHEGVVFKLRIVKISKDELVFMNTKNEETATVRLGVVKGLGGSNAGAASLKDSIKLKSAPVRIK